MPRQDYAMRATGRIGDEKLAQRIGKAINGKVMFDPFSRGRYATDASHYQVEPVGVVVPETAVAAALAIRAHCPRSSPLVRLPRATPGPVFPSTARTWRSLHRVPAFLL